MEGSLLLPLSACIVLPIQVQQAGRAWEGLQSRQRQLSRRRRRAWRRLCLAAAARPLSRLAYGAPPISRWALVTDEDIWLLWVHQYVNALSVAVSGQTGEPLCLRTSSRPLYTLCVLTMGL